MQGLADLVWTEKPAFRGQTTDLLAKLAGVFRLIDILVFGPSHETDPLACDFVFRGLVRTTVVIARLVGVLATQSVFIWELL